MWFVALRALTFSNSWFDLVEQYGGAWPWLVEDTLRAFVAPVFVALAPAVVVAAGRDRVSDVAVR
ncbi:MAG: hypothetical protein U0531_19055 [Dehalococcoidia bacterium]